MIEMLFSLNGKYQNKEIYIWDINRDAVTVFTLLAFRKVNISGFVSVNEKFIGQRFVNRQIVGIEHLKERKNAVIIASDHCHLSDIRQQDLPEDVEWINYSKTLALNENVRNKRLIVYGIGKMGEEIYQILDQEGIGVEAFCVSDRQNNKLFHGKPVIAFDDLDEKARDAVIIAVKNDDDKFRIQKKLEMGNVKHIYVDEIADSYFDQEVFFQAINLAIEEHKKIYVYGCRDGIAEFLEDIMSVYNIKIEGYVNDQEFTGQNIDHVYDLCYFEASEIFVIINECNVSELQRKCETLDQIGLSLEDFNYTSLRRTTVDYTYVDFHAPDTLIGAGLLVNEKYPGFFVYGNDQADDIRILVLGGSTSADGIYRPQCWSKYLYEKLMGENYAATVFNCAYPGHDVVQELLHLIRDGFAVKPNIVISMSGVNNIVSKDKVVNQFNVASHMDWIRALDAKCKVISGLKCQEKQCEFWFRIESIMEAVSKIYGAEFYGILQPMQCAKEDKNLLETGIYQSEKSKESVKQFKTYANDRKGIINMISRFDKEENMFIDFAHYSDKANKLLADIVYGFLLSDIQRIKSLKEKSR